jgi:hypothetical protein
MRTEGSGWNTPGLGIHTECVRPYRAPLMRLPFASPPWRPTRPQREGVRWSRCDPPPPLGLSTVSSLWRSRLHWEPGTMVGPRTVPTSTLLRTSPRKPSTPLAVHPPLWFMRSPWPAWHSSRWRCCELAVMRRTGAAAKSSSPLFFWGLLCFGVWWCGCNEIYVLHP